MEEEIIEKNQNDEARGKSNFIAKAGALGKKMVGSVASGVKTLANKTKQNFQAHKIKKYNPLFPEQFKGNGFKIPNIIEIVDDAVRRGVDVCEGAIGWLANKNGTEVLYLYDEAVKMSKIEFVPVATCGAVYYVDSFNRNRFIRVDCIFSKAHEERLAELEHIAYSLGAKCCSIKIVEKSAVNETTKTSSKYKINKEQALDVNMASQSGNNNERSGSIVTYFEGNNSPKQPKLKWFAHDDNMKRLIEMRCSSANVIKSKTLELEGVATMSQKVALAIDAVMGKSSKTKSDIEKQAVKESKNRIIFNLEF